MTNFPEHDSTDAVHHRRSTQHQIDPVYAQQLSVTPARMMLSYSLHRNISANTSARTSVLHQAQRIHGNRAVQRYVQRTAPTVVQRSDKFPFDWMFPEQAYDTPTSGEIREAERLMQKLLGMSDDAVPSSQAPTLEAPTVPRPAPGPGPVSVPEPVTPRLPTVELVPNTLRSPTSAVQPSPAPAPEIPVIEPGAPKPPTPTPAPHAPGPDTMRSPGAGAGGTGLLSRIFQNPLVRYGGGALGIIGGGATAYSGADQIDKAADNSRGFFHDIGDTFEGVYKMGMGGLGAAGGVGMVAGSSPMLAAAGELGLVLAAGYGGYKVGEAIGEYGIDRYLNRVHTEDAENIDENYRQSWAYTINEAIEGEAGVSNLNDKSGGLQAMIRQMEEQMKAQSGDGR
jgi:hypothetical protein